MNEEWLNAAKELTARLGEKIGEGSDYFWPILVRHQVISASVAILAGVCAVVAAVFFIMWARWSRRVHRHKDVVALLQIEEHDRSRPADGEGSAEDRKVWFGAHETLLETSRAESAAISVTYVVQAIACVIIGIGVLAACCSISQILNPEYFALHEVIGMLE